LCSCYFWEEALLHAAPLAPLVLRSEKFDGKSTADIPLTRGNLMTVKRRVLLISIVPPRNDCGVRIVMYRHFIDRSPFELHVASNAEFAEGLVIHTHLRLPYLIDRLRKSRFGPRLAAWVSDYENFVWSLTTNDALEEAV